MRMSRLVTVEAAGARPAPAVPSALHGSQGGRPGPGHGHRGCDKEVTMTSATYKPATGGGGRYAERHGYGLVIFAAVLLLVLGCFNLLDGIAAIANSHVFI